MYYVWAMVQLSWLAYDRHLLSVIESVVGDDKYDNHASLPRGIYSFIVGHDRAASICCGVSNGPDTKNVLQTSRGTDVLSVCFKSSRRKHFRHTSFGHLRWPWSVPPSNLKGNGCATRYFKNLFSFGFEETFQWDRKRRDTKSVCSLTSFCRRLATVQETEKIKIWKSCIFESKISGLECISSHLI